MGLGRRLMQGLVLAPMLLNSATAAPFESATVRRIIDGREVYIDRQQAKVNAKADRGQQISTGSSRTELLFDKRAIGFLGQNSLITLGQECFRLKSGRVLVNGPQASCLGSKVLGVRGTTYVLSSTEDGGYDLAVLTGTATVGEAAAIETAMAAEEDVNILSTYPSLSPVVGLGSSAWGSNAYFTGPKNADWAPSKNSAMSSSGRLCKAKPAAATIMMRISAALITRIKLAFSTLSAICPAVAENNRNGKMNRPAATLASTAGSSVE